MAEHKSFGTCEDANCRFHGLCHCGCGGQPAIAFQTWRRCGATIGYRWMYLRGHSNRGERHTGGAPAWSRNGVPVERVAPLVKWLTDHYGLRGSARLLGLTPQYLFKVRERKFKHVRPQRAREFAEAVLAHRRQGLASVWDVEPRAVLAEERRNDDREREYKRTERERRRVSA